MNKKSRQVSCIILAGGEGKRLGGVDKGLVTYKSTPLIEHVLASIKPQVDEIIISANRNIDTYEKYGHKVISDNSDVYRGPLAGIAATLPYCTNKWVLVVPCDMPFLPDNIVEKLSAETDKGISIAALNEKLQLVFLMHKELQASIQQSLDNNQLRLLQWVKSHQPAIISFTDYGAFRNFNNRDDLD
jgi:molybdopterin-guanine dinucleotide biosynthesis protein A